MLAGIFNANYSSPAPPQAKIGHTRVLFNVQTFQDDWLRSNRVRCWVDIHAVGPILPIELRRTFTYSPSDRSLLVEIRTMFVDHTLRGGAPPDPKIRKRLLEAEAWVASNTMGRRHVWCLGCRKRVDFFQDDFDLREWQQHRDSCFGITDLMKKAVVKEIFWQNCQKELAQCAVELSEEEAIGT
ncbi:hypothetical protein IW261DRAFT_650382 [Armillaria novae-zelandiae]|uniref:Uncharacterized protein n=1 Tax=Armillaria novae-zelandiae TaxID=153914 RepID=A0AA39ULH2_9AGAR|nr:hypothetical protein IW261DRAFT_650382 [Armillaria novae-zelandiae]